MENAKLDKIIELLEKINANVEPETYTWKLKDKMLIEKHFLEKLNSVSQKRKYMQMVLSIAEKNGLKIQDMENWPTDPLRHLFYSSCKWIGVKEGKDKKYLSNLIFDITSNKRGKLEYNNQNKEEEEKISLFGENEDVKLF